MRYIAVVLIVILSSCSGLFTNVDSMKKKASDFSIRGDYFSAKKIYEDLLLKDVDSAPDYLLSHAYCLWKLEKHDEAIDELNELISQYPGKEYNEYTDSAITTILYIKAEKHNKNIYIIKELKKYLEDNPEGKAVDSVQYCIGGLYLLSQNYPIAREAFNKLIKDYPSSKYLWDAKFVIGESYFLEKDYENSKKYFEDFIKQYQDQNPSMAGDAKTYLRMIEEITPRNNK